MHRVLINLRLFVRLAGVVLFGVAAPLVAPAAGDPAIVPLTPKEPAVESGTVGGETFAVSRPRLGLNSLFRAESETFRSRGTEQTTSLFELREGFSVATDGWLLHPAFLQLELQADPQWSQMAQSGDGPGVEDSSVFLASYSVEATLLPEKIYTLQLFADRNEDNLLSAFSNQTRVETDSYGASLAHKVTSLPSYWRYLHLNRSQEGFFDTEEERDDLRLDASNQYGNSDTHVSLQYIDSRQTSDFSELELRDLNARLDNTWRFAADANRQLFSDLSYRQSEDDDFDQADFRLVERLYLKHRPNLWTNSSLLFQDRQSDRFSEELYRLDSELTHLLYENLTSTLSGGGERRNFDDGGESAYTGAVDFDYRRPIPWGTFGAGAGVRDVYTLRNGTQDFLVVSNEPLVLVNGQGTFLAEEFIDPDSLRVTDATGTIVFVRDVDYLVEQVGTFLRLRRSLLGNIAADQTVLVSYRFARESGFDDNVVSQSYSATLFLFSTLRLSYNLFHRDQQVVAGPEPVNPIDDTLQRTVLQLFYRWTETRLSYEDFATTTSPARTTWRAEELFQVAPAKELLFRLSGYYGETDFTGGGEQESFYGTGSSLSWAPTYWTKVGVEGYMDWVSGETTDSSNGGALAFWQLLYGRWQTKLSYRYRDTRDQIQDFQRSEHRILFVIEKAL